MAKTRLVLRVRAKKEPPQPVCGGSFHEGGAPSELALEGVGYQVR